jgi:hypothetical protein
MRGRSWLSPWLARLAPSFFIICCLLLWSAYRAAEGQMGPVSRGRIVLFLVAAVLAFVMGVIGTRERHRLNRNG